MWESLKKILKTSNEKAVIIEDGQPRYVVLSVEEYLKLNNQDTSDVPSQNLNPSQSDSSQDENLAQIAQNTPPISIRNQEQVDLSNFPIDLATMDNDFGQYFDDDSVDLKIEDLPV